LDINLHISDLKNFAPWPVLQKRGNARKIYLVNLIDFKSNFEKTFSKGIPSFKDVEPPPTDSTNYYGYQSS